MPESNTTNYALSKWIIALAIGIPAIGYIYYSNYYTRKKKEVQKPKAPKTEIIKNESNERVETVAEEEGPLDRALILKNFGNEFFKQRSYTEAIRCYTEAIDLCPKEKKSYLATFYQNRAAAHEMLKNTDKVIEDLNEAIKSKNNYLKALMRRYKNLEKIGNLRQALEDATACCLLEQFSNEETLNASNRILKALGAEEAKKFQQNRKPILPSNQFLKTYFQSFEHDPIVQSLNQQVNGNVVENGEVETGFNAAKTALREGKYEEILDHCNEELTNTDYNRETPNETYLSTLLLRATMYILTTQIQLALEDLNYIIDMKPENNKILVNALLKRASVRIQLDEPLKALEDFDAATNIDPMNSDAALQKAQILLICEELPKAIAEFERAVKLSPQFPLSQVQKIYAEYRKAVIDKNIHEIYSAKLALKETINNYPTCSEGYTLLAQMYADSQDFDEAESVFIQGFRVDPLNATLLVHFGLLYLQWKGDLNNAIKYMEKAIEVDPKCEFAYETLASVEAQRGNLPKAFSLFDKALPLSKNEKEAAHLLSLKAAVQVQHLVSTALGISPIGNNFS